MSNHKLIPFFLILFFFSAEIVTAQKNTIPNFPIAGSAGMEVNTYSGKLFLQRQDLFLSGRGMDIDLQFYYNPYGELGTTDWGYGNGWSHTYYYSYRVQSDTVTIFKPDGRKLDYKRINNGSSFTPPTGVKEFLTEYEPGKYLLRTLYGIEYYFENPTYKKLTKIVDLNGNHITLNWTGFTELGSIVDASGREITFNWSNGHLASIVDANDNPARVWTYSYDLSRLTSVTDPLGNQQIYEYQPQSPWLARHINEVGDETTVTYYGDSGSYSVHEIASCLAKYSFTYFSGQGRTLVKELVGDKTESTLYDFDSQQRNVARKGNCCGFETHYEFDAENNISKITDANGNATTYTYNFQGLVTGITDPLGCSLQYTYGQYGRVATTKDKNGNTTTFTYDAKGNLTAVSRPLGVSESFTYDAFGNQTSYTDARGNTTNYAYNANGYLTQISYPISGLTTQLTYDNRGNRLSRTDGNDHTTHFKYDLMNRLTEVEDPLGNKTTYEYDAKGNRTKTTNALGNVTEYHYDQLDRVVEAEAPLNTVLKYSYDSRGNLLGFTDQRGSTTTYNYDERNFLLSKKDPLGYETNYTYDGLGNQTSITDPNGNATQYTYDEQNRLIRTQDALGFQTVYAYDCNGNPLSVTDANGNTTSYAYDALNRQVSTTDALGFTTNFEYDKNNNLTKITDAKGNPTSYEYDAMNRKTKETYADNTTKVFTYDGAGNVTSRKDNAGNMTFYTYDDNNRLTLRDYPDANDDHFSYDPLGRMAEATNQNAVVTFTYDALNRLLGETLNGKTTGYAYNNATGKRTLIYPSGKVIEEYYDTRNQLASIKESGETIASFAYDPAGRMTTRSYGNGTVTTYAYDADNRVTDIIANPNEFINFHYAYDNVGNKLYEEKKHHPTHSEEYGYDAKYQLTSFKVGTLANGEVAAPLTQSVFDYDEMGNRTIVTVDGIINTYQANTMNEYTSVSGNQNQFFNYDNNGNLISFNNVSYEFNYNNLLFSVNNGSSNVYYIYDAFGRKINTTYNGKTYLHYYRRNNNILVFDDSEKKYETSILTDRLDEIIFKETEEEYFIHQNLLNSVVAETKSNNNLQLRIEYDAFGNKKTYDKDFNSINVTNFNQISFGGRQVHPNFEDIEMRNRIYNFAIGRFLQRDALNYEDDFNLYSYVKNNPINFFDPLGTESLMTPPKNDEGGFSITPNNPSFGNSASASFIPIVNSIGISGSINTQGNINICANFPNVGWGVRACTNGNIGITYGFPIIGRCNITTNIIEDWNGRPRIEVGGTINLPGINISDGIIINLPTGNETTVPVSDPNDPTSYDPRHHLPGRYY
ncbi:MAG: hypothetical protein H6577_18955 [Lewinellaceae bacterium]|nr:hypothetical protein [Lewinellaceae bacterium]